MPLNTMLTGLIVAIGLFVGCTIILKILKIGFSILKFKILLGMIGVMTPVITGFLYKMESIIHFIN